MLRISAARQMKIGPSVVKIMGLVLLMAIAAMEINAQMESVAEAEYLMGSAVGLDAFASWDEAISTSDWREAERP